MKRVIDAALKRNLPKAWIELQIARRNRYFEPEFWLIPTLCDPARTAVDVGGNFGIFAYYMAKHARHVHVFEPNPQCARNVRQTARRNVTLHTAALSDHVGEATLRFDPTNSGVGTIDDANRLDNNPGIRGVIEVEVQIAPLDSFALEPVGFMKIDVEGHEAAVIAGGGALLARDRPVLMIESEIRHNASAFPKLRATLDPLGYVCWYLKDRALVPLDGSDLSQLQVGRPETNPDYINNFFFLPQDGEALGRLRAAVA